MIGHAVFTGAIGLDVKWVCCCRTGLASCFKPLHPVWGRCSGRGHPDIMEIPCTGEGAGGPTGPIAQPFLAADIDSVTSAGHGTVSCVA